MATKGDFEDRIRLQLGDTSTRRHSDAEILQWVQDAHDDLAHDTEYYLRESRADISDDVEEYDLSSVYPVKIHWVAILQGASETSYYLIDPVSYRHYREGMNGQITTTTPSRLGTPTGYTVRGDYLYLDPCPDYDATNGLYLYYSALDVLSASTSTSHLPQQFHEAVVWYGMWRVHLKDEDPGQANAYLNLYEKKKTELRQWAKTARMKVPRQMPADDQRRGIIL